MYAPPGPLRDFGDASVIGAQGSAPDDRAHTGVESWPPVVFCSPVKRVTDLAVMVGPTHRGFCRKASQKTRVCWAGSLDGPKRAMRCDLHSRVSTVSY